MKMSVENVNSNKRVTKSRAKEDRGYSRLHRRWITASEAIKEEGRKERRKGNKKGRKKH